MSKKICVIGCGQLGSRHLQAIIGLDQVSHVHVIDPYEESLNVGKKRVEQVKDRNQNIVYSWSPNFDAQEHDYDLGIVATLADVRCAQVKKAYEQLDCKNFLIEKIVSQSVAEYEELMDFANSHGLKIWVNCKSRAYSIHQHIKSILDPEEPILFTAIGGNHGLANNGIHEADLFAMHDGSEKIHCASAQIDPSLLSSKRGNSISDLSGTLTGFTDKGSHFTLSFAGDHMAPDTITINSSKARFIIDHLSRLVYEAYAEDDWKWKPYTFDDNLMVSYMSRQFVNSILTSGTCLLPTLKECYPAHEFILNALLPQFNQLMNKEQKYCPVT